MLKINAILMITIVTAACVFSENTSEPASLPKLYLKYKADGFAYDQHTGFRIIRKPYYGFDPDYLDIKVKYFGRNIAKDLAPVPKAEKLMNGYTIHGIGMIVCFTAGVGIITTSVVNAIKQGSKQKEDGTYDTKVPAGIPIGFGVIGLGLVLNWTKPIYLHLAVNEYNKYAKKRSF